MRVVVFDDGPREKRNIECTLCCIGRWRSNPIAFAHVSVWVKDWRVFIMDKDIMGA
jgi:hypothetical protein